MKVYYQCETCGKHFETAEGAKDCEKKHEDQRIRNEKLSLEKDSRANKISSLLQEYVNDYNEMPDINTSFISSHASSLPWWFFDIKM